MSSACGTRTTTPYSSSSSGLALSGLRRTGCPSTRCRSTPIGRHPTDGTDGSGTQPCFPTRVRSCDWTRSHGIDITLNVHSSIADNDPKLAAAQRIAGGGTFAPSSCTGGPCKVWDWSAVAQAESNFALQQTFPATGSGVLVAGLVLRRVGRGHARADSRLLDRPSLRRRRWSTRVSGDSYWPASARPTTTRSGLPGRAVVRPHVRHRLHRRCVGHLEHLGPGGVAHPDEATIGQPYVSDDIGSFLGRAGSRAPGSGRSLRPLGAVRNLPARPAAALSPMGIDCPGSIPNR